MQKDLYDTLDVPLKNIELNHCWVGGSKETFTEYGGKPNLLKHVHHIVPRAFGGKDGPTVTLCDSHHNSAHYIALKIEAGKPYHEFLTGDSLQDKRLLWLASIICNAKAWAKDDPNKPIPITFVAKGATKIKLKRLKAMTKLKYADLMELCISNLYNRHFKND